MMLSPGIQRIVAIALLAIVLLLGWSLLIEPVRDSYAEAQATIASLSPVIARGSGDDFTELRANVARLEAQRNEAAGLLTGSESIAAAQLQARLKAISDAAKGELKSTQILPGKDEGNFRRITVRGQIVGDIVSVQHILYALEANSPYFILDNVEIRVAGTREGGLDLRLDVSGYIRRVT